MEALSLATKGAPGQDGKASAQSGAGTSPTMKPKKKKAKKSVIPAGPAASGSASACPTPTSKFYKKAKQSKASAVVKYTGLGARPIVDDFSDRQSVVSYDKESVYSPTLYEEAASFISSCVTFPFVCLICVELKWNWLIIIVVLLDSFPTRTQRAAPCIA